MTERRYVSLVQDTQHVHSMHASSVIHLFMYALKTMSLRIWP